MTLQNLSGLSSGWNRRLTMTDPRLATLLADSMAGLPLPDGQRRAHGVFDSGGSGQIPSLLSRHSGDAKRAHRNSAGTRHIRDRDPAGFEGKART